MVEIAPVKVRYSDGQRKVSTASWLGNQTRDMYERPRQRSRAEFSAICDKGGLAFLCRMAMHSFMRLPAFRSPVRSDCDI
jgi:hypothetical protein